MLDIEVAGAVAPGAKIVVYFAPNTDAGFLDAITTAASTTRQQAVGHFDQLGRRPRSNWTAAGDDRIRPGVPGTPPRWA